MGTARRHPTPDTVQLGGSSTPVPLTDTAILDGLPVAVWVCDGDGRILRFNPRALAFWGRVPTPAERYYGPATPVEPDGSRLPEDRLPVALALACAGPMHQPSQLIERPDGSRVSAALTAIPLLDGRGHLAGIAVVVDERAGSAPCSPVRTLPAERDEIVAALAHELRQPLNVATAALSVMAQRMGREPGIRARSTVQRQVQQMQRIVEDLLQTERLLHGHVQLRHEEVDLLSFVGELAEAVRLLVTERRQRLEVRVPEGPVTVWIDPVRVQQVLMNVLANAVRYTGDGGRIALQVTVRDGHALITVRDSGRGIEPAGLERIFEPFTREAADGQGLGVGLAVARRLLELHGGTIEARSLGRGHGSEFIIALPKKDEGGRTGVA